MIARVPTLLKKKRRHSPDTIHDLQAFRFLLYIRQ